MRRLEQVAAAAAAGGAGLGKDCLSRQLGPEGKPVRSSSRDIHT